LGVALLMISASNAIASQTAELVCAGGSCETYELHVHVSTGQDAGHQGAFGIFAVSESNQGVAYWTEANGWLPYSDRDLIKPTGRGLRTLEPRRDYIVFRGSKGALCKLSNGQSFNLYAWHSAMTVNQINRVKSFLNRFEITGWQAENYWNSILFYQATALKKGGMVFTQTCLRGE